MLWLPCLVGLLYIELALLDVPQALPDLWPLNVLVLTVAAIATLGAWQWPLFLPPSSRSATRLLEQALSLPHDPLSVLADRPASGDAGLWNEHQARARALLAQAPTGKALRRLMMPVWSRIGAMCTASLLLCLGMAGSAAPLRLWQAFAPGVSAAAMPRVTAWATPPDYTNLPPISLPSGGAVHLPIGSHLYVDLENGGRIGSMRMAGASVPFHELDKSTWQADAPLTKAGRIVVRSGFQSVARWKADIIPDQPPQVEWATPPVPVRPKGSRYPKVKLVWRASDDYGLKSLAIDVRLTQKPGLPHLIRALPMSSDPKSTKGAAYLDLIANPWAGLSVTLRLDARDGAGQQGHSADQTCLLPMPQLMNPAAQNVLEVRRDLSIDPLDAATLRGKIEAIQAKPEAQSTAPAVAEAFTATFKALDGPTADLTTRAQQSLWALALKIETQTIQKKTKRSSGGQQEQEELKEIIQRQKDLLARSEDRVSAQGNDGDAGSQQADQRMQSGLRDSLDRLIRKTEATTGERPADLQHASDAMQQATLALAQPNDRAAIMAQRKALDYLQQEAAGSGGGGQGEQEQSAGEQEDDQSRDPLGRPLDQQGQTASDSDQNPITGGSNLSARKIQDELRQRAAQRTRPQAELDYLNRLLNGTGF